MLNISNDFVLISYLVHFRTKKGRPVKMPNSLTREGLYHCDLLILIDNNTDEIAV